MTSPPVRPVRDPVGFFEQRLVGEPGVWQASGCGTMAVDRGDKRQASLAAERQELTRSRIRRAAMTVVAQHGFDATVEQIAEVSGVSPRTIFRHYGTHDRLIVETVRDMFEECGRYPDVGSPRDVDDLAAWIDSLPQQVADVDTWLEALAVTIHTRMAEVFGTAFWDIYGPTAARVGGPRRGGRALPGLSPTGDALHGRPGLALRRGHRGAPRGPDAGLCLASLGPHHPGAHGRLRVLTDNRSACCAPACCRASSIKPWPPTPMRRIRKKRQRPGRRSLKRPLVPTSTPRTAREERCTHRLVTRRDRPLPRPSLLMGGDPDHLRVGTLERTCVKAAADTKAELADRIPNRARAGDGTGGAVECGPASTAHPVVFSSSERLGTCAWVAILGARRVNSEYRGRRSA